MGVKKLLKADRELIAGMPRGFALPCGEIVQANQKRATASPCGEDGLVYAVHGELIAVDLVLCPRHRDKYLAQGLRVHAAPGLIQLRRRAERETTVTRCADPLPTQSTLQGESREEVEHDRFGTAGPISGKTA